MVNKIDVLKTVFNGKTLGATGFTIRDRPKKLLAHHERPNSLFSRRTRLLDDGCSASVYGLTEGGKLILGAREEV